MNRYTVVADISSHIVNLLKQNMIPEPILSEDLIGVCSPNEKGDLVLGVYLYDIRESEHIHSVSMVNMGINKQKFPPTYLTLFYMITAYSNTEIKFKYLDDQKILGRVIQVLTDNSIINISELTNSPNILIPEVKIQMLDLNNEEKNKIWNFSNLPYRLSMCFKVFPLELESTRVREVQRVVDVMTDVKEKYKNFRN